MISINIKNLPSVASQLRDVAVNQIPFATSLALNNSAYSLLQSTHDYFRSVFDRPTPLIVNSIQYNKSTKQDLKVKIFITPARVQVVGVHEFGGFRHAQRLETFLYSKGWLPSGYQAVPAKGMQLDSYGNPSQQIIDNIIQSLPSISGISGDVRRHFVIPPSSSSHLTPGIYRTLSRSKNQAIMRLYNFVTIPIYKQRLNVEKNIIDIAATILDEEITNAISIALRTAK